MARELRCQDIHYDAPLRSQIAKASLIIMEISLIMTCAHHVCTRLGNSISRVLKRNMADAAEKNSFIFYLLKSLNEKTLNEPNISMQPATIIR